MENRFGVIHNIISNAIKYMDKPKGNHPDSQKDVGDFIQVEIEDNGKGIAAKGSAVYFLIVFKNRCSRNSSKGGKRNRSFHCKEDPGGIMEERSGQQAAWNQGQSCIF